MDAVTSVFGIGARRGDSFAVVLRLRAFGEIAAPGLEHKGMRRARLPVRKFKADLHQIADGSL